ncbi:MAG: DUF1330 domain-containing protein [Rhodobacteraceae bacterium]|nr:DUF1330 domain-containing protein [Paracoccaceae bacterium]
MNYKSFSGEDFNAFREIQDSRPLNMLNLVKVFPTVEYPDGEIVSGIEAYKRYGRLSYPIFERLGGKIIWRGEMLLSLIGPSEEKWDFCFIAEYPNTEAFVSMVKDPDYREAVKHRQISVQDSRLIRMAPLSNGKNFSE